jgi:hypothetical protein
VLTHLGDALADVDRAAARAGWRQAVDILDQLGHVEDADRLRSRLHGT